MSIDLSDMLACGADADDLLAQVADGRAGERSPHQRQCPHCQAALAEYDRLWSPVREMAAAKFHARGSWRMRCAGFAAPRRTRATGG